MTDAPPVVYIAGAPCRTIPIQSGFFVLRGEFYRLTRITMCGKRVTVRIKPVTP